ncbi:hypothetical protein OS493_020229 [Desmophyllum pertusum]|uniref:Thiolase N-terminal domain-containing protein n=1 Tax=Desmophyllum pertusum TaxID=174260 RepID=A0A9W9ZNK2_9CNID|nr:hypothetical protein OS493_020229 [Desmophyllum pertusum]
MYKSNETYSQQFLIRKESEDELHLKAIAHVHMKGHIRSIEARNVRCTKVGTVVGLRLSHKWGSETIDLVTLSDPTARDACVPNLEVTAEMSQLTIGNEYPAVPTTSPMDPSVLRIRIRNHKHSIHNPNACLRKEIPLKGITHSKMICKPITLAMSAPTADGSAAAVVCSREFMESNGMQNKAVEIIAQQMVTDLPSSFDQSFLDLAGVAMARKAAADCYRSAGLTPGDVNVLDVHDCFLLQ